MYVHSYNTAIQLLLLCCNSYFNIPFSREGSGESIWCRLVPERGETAAAGPVGVAGLLFLILATPVAKSHITFCIMQL